MEIQSEVMVSWRLGLHIRPATKIVKLLKAYSCEIKFLKDDVICDAKSVIQLLTLEAGIGDILDIHAVGEDAKEASTAVTRFFREYKDMEESIDSPFQ